MKKTLFFVMMFLMGFNSIPAQTTDSIECQVITDHPWYMDFGSNDYYCWQTVGGGGWGLHHSLGATGIVPNGGFDAKTISSPAVVLPVDSSGLRLYWKDKRLQHTPTYNVMVSTTNRYDLSSYDTLATYSLNSGSELTQRSVSIGNYAGDTVYFAFNKSGIGSVMIADVQMYNALIPLGILESPSNNVATGDTVNYVVHLSQADDSLLTFSWHSTLLDTTFVTTDSFLTIVYPSSGSESMTVTVSNAYGTLVLTKGLGVFVCDTIRTLPWSEDFMDADIIASYNRCWQLSGYQRLGNSEWITEEDGSHSAKYDMMSSSHYGDYMVSPPILVPNVIEKNLSLWVEHIWALMAIIETDSVSDTVYVSYNSSDHMMRRTIPLAPYSGQTIRVRLVNNNNNWYNQISRVDRIRVDYDTLPVVVLSGPNMTTTDSATLFVASFYRGYPVGVTYNWNSALGGTISTNAAGDSAWVTYNEGIGSSIDTVEVVPSNIYGSSTSNRTIFVKDCGTIVNFPWTEDFFYGDNCWYKPEGSNWHDAVAPSPPYDANNNDYRALTSSRPTDSDDHWIISNAITLPADTNLMPTLFWDAASSDRNSSNKPHYSVWVSNSTDPTDLTSFSLLYDDTVGLVNCDWEWSRFSHRSVSLVPYAGQTIHIAFCNHPINSNVGVVVDNVTIRAAFVPVLNVGATATTYYYGDTATFTANLTEGNPSGLTYTWHSTLLDTTWALSNSNIWTLTYGGLQGGYDTVSVIATNLYGSDTASVRVNYVIINQPEVGIIHNDVFVYDTTVYTAQILNHCVTDSMTYTWHSTLLNITNTFTHWRNNSFSVLYPVEGYDTITLIASNRYASDTAVMVVRVRNCSPRVIPWTEDFEGVTATASNVVGELPTCWDYHWNGSNVVYAPHVITTGGYPYINNIPNHALFMVAGSESGYGNQAEVILPRMGGTMYQLALALDYRFESSSKGTLAVGYYNGNTFNVLSTLTPYGGNYRRDTIPLSNVTDPNAKLVLRWTCNQSYFAVAIDNLEVFYSNAYLTLAGLAVDSVEATSAHVSWNPVQWATAYHLVVRSDADTSEYTVYDTTFQLTGLNHSTWYTIDVTGIADNDTGAYISVKFATLCLPWELPYYEDFESVSASSWNVIGELPLCWDFSYNGRVSNNTSYAPHVISPIEYPYITINHPGHTLIMVAADTGSLPSFGGPAEVILPCFTEDLRTLMLAFDHIEEGSYWMDETLSVGYYDTNNVFTAVDTLPNNLNGTNYYLNSNDFHRDTISFANAISTNGRIAIQWANDWNYHIAIIDNLEVFRDTSVFVVNLTVNDPTMGAVSGANAYHDSSIATIIATPFEGYHFVEWNDHDTHAVRQILVKSDITFTAFFARDTIWRTVSVTANADGACELYGSGRYADSSTVEIGYNLIDTATNGGYWQFLGWNDGPTEAPRSIVVTSDTAIVALFEWVEDSVGISEIDNSKLRITIFPNPATNVVTISVNEPSVLTLLDLSGRTVIPLTPVSSILRLATSDLPEGVYFVRVTTANGTVVRKLVLQ